MPVLLVILVVLLALAATVVAVGGGSAWALLHYAPRALRRATQREIGSDPQPSAPRTAKVDPPPTDAPGRLALLERQLADNVSAAQEQLSHLEARRTALEAREDRSEIAARYADDAAMLTRRVARMRTVLGLVWRARAWLLLRRELAGVAASRPALDGLPDVDAADTDLGSAAAHYDRASRATGALARVARSRASGLRGVVPAAPRDADDLESLRADVEVEAARVESQLHELGDRMEKLADTLGYLADRCRTRRVVEGTAPAAMGTSDLASVALIDEARDAMDALAQLEEAGAARLEGLDIDRLARGITQLERAGIEARAEAEAAIEAARLLEGV